jgi:hypothetical protein
MYQTKLPFVFLTIFSLFVLNCDNGVSNNSSSIPIYHIKTLYFKASQNAIQKMRIIPIGGTQEVSIISTSDSIMKVSINCDSINSCIYVSTSQKDTIYIGDLIYIQNLKQDSVYFIHSCLPDSVYLHL